VTGFPADYYRSIREVEDRHWWHVGMRELAAALLGERLRGRLLDAGCGTGGFLAWAAGVGRLETLAGIDVSEEAVELARARLPGTDLRVAPIGSLPFDAGSFDVAAANDVLQHLGETELAEALAELHRVLRPGGTLLVRTNGALSGRRAAADWQLFDRRSLASVLHAAGFRCERLTHANLLGSALAALAGHSPQPPTGTWHGIPKPPPRLAGAVGLASLRLEALHLARPGRTLPFGHTLFAVARREVAP